MSPKPKGKRNGEPIGIVKRFLEDRDQDGDMDKDDGEVADKDRSNIDDDLPGTKAGGGMKDEDGSHANNISAINASDTRIKKNKNPAASLGTGINAAIQSDTYSGKKEMDIEINFALS